MTRAAAFFDLDKTLLAKSSTLAYAKPLYQQGLLNRGDLIKSAYSQFMYLLAGADDQQMEQMRAYLSDLVKGWDVEHVREIVTDALGTVIEPIVYSEALTLFDEHHHAGRDVIVISSSGTEIIEPICTLLGADKAIGTQVAIEDGKYTGEILFYAYGPGKAQAIRAIAEDEGYDLSECYAYSDSITDLPMLEAIGHPFPTNPDKELRELARERVWPVLDFRKPVAMRTRSTHNRSYAAAASAGAAALGIAWYTTNRLRHNH
ncbi:MAG: HAD-IB family hydrolase [Actinomycetes bacterium]